jgi:hypothetical protein
MDISKLSETTFLGRGINTKRSQDTSVLNWSFDLEYFFFFKFITFKKTSK